jgi:membrane associated rhomboid family serine protease
MIPISDDNPARLRPYVTWALILACTGVYFWQLMGINADENVVLLEHYGFVPRLFFSAGFGVHPDAAPWLSLLTSMFLHGGFLHLGGNMLYLWIFGNNVEDAMGHVRYLAFYLVCGVAAALSEAFVDPSLAVPMLGASGAISGVLAAYVLIFPRARVTVIVPLGIILYPLKISAFYVVGFWFLMQLLNVFGTGAAAAGTAWGAHVGGFIAGIALTPLLSRFPLFGRRLIGPPNQP